MVTNASSNNPKGPNNPSGSISIGESVQMSITKITLTLGLLNKNLIPSDERRVGAFLMILGSQVIDLTIPGCSECLKL